MDRKRILIVDDDESVRSLLARALKIWGYEIDTVRNGVEAITQVEKRSYDLVITDYMMPKMDGLELTRRIKAEHPSIPILLVTSNGPVYDLLKNGAAACIIKPFSIFELQNTVKTILDRMDKG